jgi:hypothetical protein
VLSIDTASLTTLEGMGWRPFIGVGQAISLFWVPSQKGRNERKKRRRRLNGLW